MNIQDFCSQQQNAFICNNEAFKPLLNFMQNNQFPLNRNSPQNDGNNPQAKQDIKFPQVPAWGSRPQKPNNSPIKKPNNNPQLPDDEHNFELRKPESKPGIIPQLPSNENLFGPPKPIATPGNPIDNSGKEPAPPGGEEIPKPLSPEPPKESSENEIKFSDFEKLFMPPDQNSNPFSSLEIPDIFPTEPEIGNIIPIPDSSENNVKPPIDDFDKECNTKAFESLMGATYKPKTKDFIKKDGKLIEKSALPKLFRVSGPTTMLTMDFVPERVNIKYEPKDRSSRDQNAEGIVTGFSCG